MSTKNNDPVVAQRAITSPQRPNQHLRRSITEQSSPFRPSLVQQYLYRKDRERDDRLPLPAGPRLRNSLDLVPGEADSGGDDMSNTGEKAPHAQRLLNKDELSQEQDGEAAITTASIQNSLVELNALSNATIANLDETYSSVIQRLGSLQSTIVAMRELAAMSQEVNESLTNESRALVSEIEAQLSVYDQSEDQKKRIRDLQIRIHTGRDKVQALSKRVDIVRERIESWERADREWQEKTRKRLRVMSIISIIAFGLICLFLWIHYGPSSAATVKFAESLPDVQGQNLSLESIMGNHSKSAATMADDVRVELTRKRANYSAVEQEAFRAFDEL